MAKLEDAKRTNRETLELLARERRHRTAAVQDPIQAWEQDMGGREAVQAWLQARLSTFPPDAVVAMRWALMDQRRSLLGGLEENVVPALAALHRISESTAQSEARRLQSVREGKRDSTVDYLRVAIDILAQGIAAPHKQRAAFNEAVGKVVADRTIRKYFQAARATQK